MTTTEGVTWPAASSPAAGHVGGEQPLFVPTLLAEVDELLAVIRRPLVEPAPITDPALDGAS